MVKGDWLTANVNDVLSLPWSVTRCRSCLLLVFGVLRLVPGVAQQCCCMRSVL